MESGDRAAGDGDEAEREDLAGEDGAGAIGEAGEGGQLQFGAHEEDADGEHEDDAELDEGAEVIARREQQPDGQGAGQEAVEDDGDGDGHRAQGEDGREAGRFADGLAGEDAAPCTSRKPMAEHSSTLPGRQ